MYYSNHCNNDCSFIVFNINLNNSLNIITIIIVGYRNYTNNYIHRIINLIFIIIEIILAKFSKTLKQTLIYF